MSSLPGEPEAAYRLKRGALRDFGRPIGVTDDKSSPYRLPLSPTDAPVPVLLKYALTLIGLKAYGPGEKVAWSVPFSYKSEQCTLVHQKFGVRIHLRSNKTEAEGNATLNQIAKQLRFSMRTVEKLILEAAPDLLGKGEATVVNQHWTLHRAYMYFRHRAVNPLTVKDEKIIREVDGMFSSSIFSNGKTQMQMNAFHDMVAAITAYLSQLEHVLVLSLAFEGFDPTAEDLTAVIGSRWGEKFDCVLGKEADAGRYRKKLSEVVEHWRNPYSHGGFEKGHSATIYLHPPGVGAEVPIGLTRIRDSPLFSLVPATEAHINEAFQLFDSLDSWLKSEIPEPLTGSIRACMSASTRNSERCSTKLDARTISTGSYTTSKHARI